MESLSGVSWVETCGRRDFDVGLGQWMKAFGRCFFGLNGNARVLGD